MDQDTGTARVKWPHSKIEEMYLNALDCERLQVIQYKNIHDYYHFIAWRTFYIRRGAEALFFFGFRQLRHLNRQCYQLRTKMTDRVVTMTTTTMMTLYRPYHQHQFQNSNEPRQRYHTHR